MNIFKRIAVIGITSSLALSSAFAQSTPNLSYGQMPTAGQWNSYFAAKQDVLGYRPLNRAGDTMTGPFYVAPSTVFKAGINFAPGVDVTNPQNGDAWISPSGFFIRVNNTTYNLGGGAIACSQLPALVGDITTTAGSCATALATVNSSPGTFGGASAVPVVTVDAKGRSTAIATTPVVAPAGTLSGGTLASNVLISSITATGTITTGVWNATAIAPAYIVTGTSGANLGLLNASKTDSGNNTYTGTNTFSLKPIVATSSSTQASINLPPGSAPATPVNGDFWTTSTGVFVQYGGTTKQLGTTTVTYPTVQRFLSGSGTYTTPVGVTYIEVTLRGGGQGGGGSGQGSPGSGGAGTTTTFGTSLLTANVGGGANTINGGTTIENIVGGGGNGGTYAGASAAVTTGGVGGVNNGGGAGVGNAGAAGTAAAANSGAGGGGSGAGSLTNASGGTGGTAGGAIRVRINAPSATYSYSVGTGGSAGTAGTNGVAGGAGGSGIVIVDEHYGS